jgi:phosphoenolpyruvate carboxylase
MELSAAIHLLGDILGEVISELESPELFAVEERIRAAAKERRSGNPGAAALLAAEVEALDSNGARAVSAAFTTYFDLVNLAEEYQRVHQLRERERTLAPRPLSESVGDAIATLEQDGVTREQMQALLDQLSIELVLTAHPTEARRRTVTSKIQRLAGLLAQIADERLTPREKDDLRAAIHAEIASLWLTDRDRTVQPAVTAPASISWKTFFGMPCPLCMKIWNAPSLLTIRRSSRPRPGCDLPPGWVVTGMVTQTSLMW